MDKTDIVTPLISIIIPVYNGSEFLSEAINSALMQSYPNIEILVVNDGSVDDGATEQVARSFGERIRYFIKDNGGVASALNMGIHHMKGEYFSWLSHDDIYKPNKILHQVEALRWLDPLTILYGGFTLKYMNGQPDLVIDIAKLFEAKDLDNPLFPIFHGIANGCTMLIHRSHFERVGLFNERLKSTQDYDMWFRMFRGQRVHGCCTLDVVIRMHDRQSSKLDDDFTREASDCWITLDAQLSETDRVNLSGTPCLFYKDVLITLADSGYTAAITYFQQRFDQCVKLPFNADTDEKNSMIIALINRYHRLYDKYNQLRHRVESTPWYKCKHSICRLASSIRHRGIAATLKLVISKLGKAGKS
jgi:glycosyltransferase involved in cell wall biosynthesis